MHSLLWPTTFEMSKLWSTPFLSTTQTTYIHVLLSIKNYIHTFSYDIYVYFMSLLKHVYNHNNYYENQKGVDLQHR